MVCPWRTRNIYTCNETEKTIDETEFLPCYGEDCPFYKNEWSKWIDVSGEVHEQVKLVCGRTDPVYAK